MILFESKEQIDQPSICIFKITETTRQLESKIQLHSKDLARLKLFSNDQRKAEFLASRFALMNLFDNKLPEVNYDEFGKPFLKNLGGHISLSHTKKYSAAVFHSTKNCGVDIEILSERIFSIAPRFLSGTEKLFTDNTEEKLKALYLVWGAKEVMYKIYGKKNLIFKEHLLVHPFSVKESGMIEAEIKIKNFHSKYQIHYRFLDKLVLLYAIEE